MLDSLRKEHSELKNCLQHSVNSQKDDGRSLHISNDGMSSKVDVPKVITDSNDPGFYGLTKNYTEPNLYQKGPKTTLIGLLDDVFDDLTSALPISNQNILQLLQQKWTRRIEESELESGVRLVESGLLVQLAAANQKNLDLLKKLHQKNDSMIRIQLKYDKNKQKLRETQKELARSDSKCRLLKEMIETKEIGFK